MPRFKLKEPLRHNGRRYEPGEEVELDAEAARRLPAETFEKSNERKSPQSESGSQPKDK